MSAFKTSLRQAGGTKSTILRAGESVTNRKVTSFEVIEDAVFSVMDAEDGSPSDEFVSGDISSLTFSAGTYSFIPRVASDVTLSSGVVKLYQS